MKKFLVLTLVLLCPFVLAADLAQQRGNSAKQRDMLAYIKPLAIEFAQTTEWMEYRRKLDPTRPYAEAVAACHNAFSHKQVEEFWYCALISQNGTVYEQVVDPETGLSVCFAEHMRHQSFPPHDYVLGQMPVCVMEVFNLPLR